MAHKITKRKLNAFIRDESMAVKEYKRFGLNNLAHDEKRHWRFLKAKKKKEY
jgi:hypothetical protein